MNYVVNPFNSYQRRYKKGDPVSDGPELEPHTVEHLTAGGFVEADREPAPSRTVPAASAAADASEA